MVLSKGCTRRVDGGDKFGEAGGFHRGHGGLKIGGKGDDADFPEVDFLKDASALGFVETVADGSEADRQAVERTSLHQGMGFSSASRIENEPPRSLQAVT